MRLAISIWNQHISPVFDCAANVLLVDGDRTHELNRQLVRFTELLPAHRVEQLAQFDIEILICGAVTRSLEKLLIASGISVLARRCGNVEEVLRAFFEGKLNDHRFCLPGCCGGHPRRRQCRARRRQPV